MKNSLTLTYLSRVNAFLGSSTSDIQRLHICYRTKQGHTTWLRYYSRISPFVLLDICYMIWISDLPAKWRQLGSPFCSAAKYNQEYWPLPKPWLCQKTVPSLLGFCPALHIFNVLSDKFTFTFLLLFWQAKTEFLPNVFIGVTEPTHMGFYLATCSVHKLWLQLSQVIVFCFVLFLITLRSGRWRGLH